jgi:hypothetical protein
MSKLYVSILVVICATLASAQSVGTVQGTVTDPTGAVVPGANVSITSAISGYKQATTTGSNGFYRFSNVPFVVFTLHAEAKGFHHTDTRAELRSNVPLTVDLQMNIAETKESIEVTEEAPLLETTSASTHHDLDYTQLQKSAVVSSGRGVEQLVQTVPGIAQDDNGRMHARGSESQVQYVVDGIPITDNLAAAFGSSLDARSLRSAEVITGNVPAEYGGKLGAVVTLNTKSGLEMPWSGSLSLSAGSFDQGDIGAEFGGHNRNVGIYLVATGSRSRRYLDPPEIGNFHNEGGNGRVLAKFDWNIDKDNILRLSLSTNGSDFQVPNRFAQEVLEQHQRQELRDDSESLTWSHVVDEKTLLDAAVYRRSSSARLLDPGLTGFPFYAAQSRRHRQEGARVNVSRVLPNQNLKFGISYIRTPINERFAIAATDPAILADPADPASAFPLASPFTFADRLKGHEFAFYAQDRLTLLKDLTVDMGIRFDSYRFVVKDYQWSPRVGLAYHISKTGTVLRAAYNRLFQTPPVENLLISSSPAGEVLSPLGAVAAVRAVPAERQNAYEVGIQQQIGSKIRLDISHYVKNIENFSDKDQFLDTGIIFPVAIARGDVRGYEARLDLTPIHGWSGYLSYANAKATATTPLVGGLFLDEATSALLVPGVQFAADHDQRNTGSFGVTYSMKNGFWANFSGRHDSGVPADFDPLILPTLPAQIAADLDPVRGRVKPRTIFDFATGVDLLRDANVPVTLQFSVRNLADTFYLYNFESVFSGTHIGRPREISGRIVFHFRGKGQPAASP